MERFNFFNHYLPAESAPACASHACLRAARLPVRCTQTGKQADRQVRLRDRTRNFKTASERSLAHSEIR